MNFKSRQYRCASGFAFLLATMLAMTGTVRASVRIGGSSLRANGQVAQGFQYTGPCPVNLKFGWGVIPTAPTMLIYSFTRSDGGSSRTSRTNLPAPGRSVPIYMDWRLGANNSQFADYRGWAQLNIESPNPVSQQIPFTLHCTMGGGGPSMGGVGEGSVRIGGSSLRANGQIAQGFQYAGPCPVNLQFGWGVIATEPTSVTYSFTRSDGASSRAHSQNLPGVNRSVPIYNDWRLGANNPEFADFRGWVQLNIESPSPVSQKIAFTLHCQ